MMITPRQCPNCCKPIKAKTRKCIHCYQSISIGGDSVGNDKVGQDKIDADVQDVADTAIGTGIQQAHLDNVSAPVTQVSADKVTVIGTQLNIGHNQVATTSTTIELKIDRNFDEYSVKDQLNLLDAIKALLTISEGDIRITKIKSGSVLVSIELPSNKVGQLLELVKTGKLKGHDVTGISFQNIELQGSDLSGINLRDTDLRGANLSSANLSSANLRDAILRDAILSGASLRGADLTDADLRGADLRGAILSSANLTDAILTDAILTDAIPHALRGVMLIIANLSYASLRGADLTDADLRGAALRGADLRNADLRGANLRGADLSGADLRGANLSDADLDFVKHDVYTKWPDGLDFVRFRSLIPSR